MSFLTKLKEHLSTSRRSYLIGILLFIIALDQINIYSLKNTRQIYIGIFRGVAVLPNDFALDTKRSKEVLLIGEKGRIATGGHFPSDSFQYMQKYAIKSSTRCGINIIKAKDRDIFSTLLYDDENFMYLVDVDGKVEDEALNFICKTQKEKRRVSNSDN